MGGRRDRAIFNLFQAHACYIKFATIASAFLFGLYAVSISFPNLLITKLLEINTLLHRGIEYVDDIILIGFLTLFTTELLELRLLIKVI